MPLHPSTLQSISFVQSFDLLPSHTLGFGFPGNCFPVGFTLHFGANLQSSWLKHLSSSFGFWHFCLLQCLRLQSSGVLQGFCVPVQTFSIISPFGFGFFGFGDDLTHLIVALQS